MTIDLRSDTVTKPCRAMYMSMCAAPVGDDVMGEDPTVKGLERYAAELTGMAAALFMPTATQSNLTAILCHCQRGDEYICGQEAHCYRWEAGGAAVAGSVQPQPLPMQVDGTLDLDQVQANIKPDDPHFARTKLLCLENTHMGIALPLKYLAQARSLASKYGLGLHIDGARAFNAAVYCGVDISAIARYGDSMTLCLSKGLGCPAGALLCGSEEIIAAARRWRKLLGGSMRQSGVLAAAGLYALQNNIARLAEDHANAQILADNILKAGIASESIKVNTNMVFLDLERGLQQVLQSYLKEYDIATLTGYTDKMRLVLHKDVTQQQAQYAGQKIAEGLLQGGLCPEEFNLS